VAAEWGCEEAMKKISSQKIAQVLNDAQTALRKVAEERDHALDKLASMERRREAEKLASVMHDKGIHLDVDHITLSDDLEKAAEEGRLPIIQQAVAMMAPNMGLKTASLNNDDSTIGGAQTDLERFIFGDVG